MESFESAGQWWLPEALDARVIGLIKYSDTDGFRLQIPFGFLGEESHFINRVNQSKITPIVHGVLVNGKTVTLFNCRRTNMTMNMPGSASEEHRAHRGFIGDIEFCTNSLIDRVHVTYAHLRDWVVWHPSESTHPIESDRLGHTADYHYKAPDDVPLAVGEGWKILLAHTTKESLPSVKGFQLEHDCFLTFDLENPLVFYDIEIQLLRPVRLFLSFCLDRNINETDLNIRLAGKNQWLNVGRQQRVSSSSEDVIMDPFMLLSLPRISERVNEILSRWLCLQGDERRAMSLLVGLTGEFDMPLDLSFLTAAQALEALSRVDAKEEELDDTEFRRRIGVVRDSITDKKVLAWAKRKLIHVNHRPSADLLCDLMSSVGDYIDSLAPDRKRFLDDIRNNRNFFTHRDDRRAERVLEGEELYVLTQGIICLLKAAILRRLGFSKEDAKTVMDDCQGALQWRGRVAEQYRKPDEALA